MEQREPVQQDCLETETVASYLDGRVSAAQRESVELHLAMCDDCRELLTEAFSVKTALDEKEIGAKEGARPGTGGISASSVTRGASRKPYLLAPWRRKIGVTGVLAAAAAVLLTVWLDPAWLRDLRGGPANASPELRELVIAASAGPNRYVEPRLTGGFAWAPPPSTMRSGNASHSLPPDLRIAIARIEQRGETDTSPDMQHMLGVALLIAGRDDDAVTTLEHAAQTRPKDATVWNDLAAAYLTRATHQGTAADLPRATTAAMRATDLAPSSAEAWFNLALAREASGDAAQARDAWNRAATLDSDPAWRAEAAGHASR